MKSNSGSIRSYIRDGELNDLDENGEDRETSVDPKVEERMVEG